MSPIPTQTEMEIAQVGLMSHGACHTFPPVVFLAPLALRFVAQNPRIPAASNSVNLFQQQPVFDSSLRVFFFVFDVTTHTVINSVQVHTLPTAQVPSALTDSFSWGHDHLHSRL